MIILKEKIQLKDLPDLEDKKYFNDMVKAVVDIEKRLLALNAELHSDLEQLMLESGSLQRNLYGINIFMDGSIEYESMINFPRNHDDGYPKAGRFVGDPKKQEIIEEIVDEWITER